MRIPFLYNISGREKDQTIEKLISRSVPSRGFFVMIVLSALMATLGVLLDSVAVLIGSMLIAPILYPILSCSMGIVMLDMKLFGQSIFTIVKAVVLSVIAAIVLTLLFPNHGVNPLGVIAFMQPSWLYAAIALVAGFAASFALSREELNETLPGVAVSVALIPPVAVIGVAIARLEWELALDATNLFIISVTGLLLSSSIVFLFMNFFAKKRVAKKVLKEEIENIEDGKK